MANISSLAFNRRKRGSDIAYGDGDGTFASRQDSINTCDGTKAAIFFMGPTPCGFPVVHCSAFSASVQVQVLVEQDG
jgi:hypothetical protein